MSTLKFEEVVEIVRIRLLQCDPEVERCYVLPLIYKIMSSIPHHFYNIHIYDSLIKDVGTLKFITDFNNRVNLIFGIN
jgi:hypothetical protein